MSFNKNIPHSIGTSDSAMTDTNQESRILNNIRDVVFELSANGQINYINAAWNKISGHTIASSVNNPFGAYIHPEDVTLYADLLNRVLNGGDSHAILQLRLLNRNGKVFWGELTLDANLENDSTTVFGQLRQLDKPSSFSLTHQNSDEKDSVTRACNRHYFESKLQERINALQNSEEQHSLLYLELLNFKLINQALSHHDGDIALKEIATLISSNLHTNDLLCRIGGYEFAIYLDNRGSDAADHIARTLLKRLANYRYSREPFSFIVGGNIGIRLIDNADRSATQYIADAVKATAISKTLGRNRSYLYSHDSNDFHHNHGCDWNHHILEAIEHNRLQLYLQPIEDIHNRTINHYEALLRMTIAETGEIIPPEQFIHAIERTGVIRDVDLWVISNAIKMLHNKPEIQRLAINLSAHAFEDVELLTLIETELKRWQVPASRIIIELTETSSLINLEQTHSVIKNLRAIGCQFALDDFGTGYCSFSYLKHLPTDYVKLDGSYIKNICENELDEAMVRSMNDIAHALGHKTIAECVESPQAITLLNSIGVDYIQGYSVGRPSPLSTLC